MNSGVIETSSFQISPRRTFQRIKFKTFKNIKKHNYEWLIARFLFWPAFVDKHLLTFYNLSASSPLSARREWEKNQMRACSEKGRAREREKSGKKKRERERWQAAELFRAMKKKRWRAVELIRDLDNIYSLPELLCAARILSSSWSPFSNSASSFTSCFFLKTE